MERRPAIQVSSAIFVGTFIVTALFVRFVPGSVSTVEIASESDRPDSASDGGAIDPNVQTSVSSQTLDTAEYDLLLRRLAHLTDADPAQDGFLPSVPEPVWPAKAAYPNPGAILPFNRIVAYYGNFYSRGMGALGQYDPDEMLRRLGLEVAIWETADPETPVVPAIDYIAVTAQLSPGADGKYRYRMPDSQMEKALDLAGRIDGIVILEVQAGLSDVMEEVRELERYLALPNVHLAIDPEFAMVASGRRPGTVVGTVDAITVNAAAEYLAGLVRDNNLPPKVLIVHRYTRPMVTNAADIVPLPEVQVVMDMDGWGPPSQKIASYEAYIEPYAVQFTGFKLFYRNDLWGGGRMMTPEEILSLMPSPSFIQYQ